MCLICCMLCADSGNRSWLTVYTLCFKKRHPFYFCENLTKYYPISIIFGSSIPEEICDKNMHVYPRHLFIVLIPYFVKIVIHLPMFTLFYCVQQYCHVSSNSIIFSRHMSEEFCNETFMSPRPPNLASHVATVPCKASNNLRPCQTLSLSKLIKQ